MTPSRVQRPLWPYCTAGALLLLAVVVVPQVGAYEGGDVVLVLGPLALVVGALLGGLVGAAVHRLTREPRLSRRRPPPRRSARRGRS